MDQLKQQLAGVAKYGFWILCGVTAIGALGIGYWSTSKLTEERDAQVAKLDADRQSMTQIRNEMSTHPNDMTKEQMDALIAELKDDVGDSWAKQYARQKEHLKWPVEELGEDFVEVFEQFEPIERELDYPPEQEVNVGLLRRYRLRSVGLARPLPPRLPRPLRPPPCAIRAARSAELASRKIRTGR